INARTKTGETAVHFAAGVHGYDWGFARSVENRRDPIEIIESLDSYGADLKALNSASQSALHFAADTGYAGTINKLLEKHLDPRVMDNRGETPLHKAIASHTVDKTEKVKLLLGGDINAPNNDGDTPLHIAATQMEASICLALLDKGAAVDQPNKK